MYRDAVLFTDNDEATRREVKANGGQVAFDFAGGVFVVRLPESVDPASLSTARIQPPALLSEKSKLLVDAWNLSHTIGMREEDIPSVNLQRNCASKSAAPPRSAELLDAVQRLKGRIAVPLLIVSGPGSLVIPDPPDFARIIAETLAGLNFLQSLNPVAAIEFMVDPQFIGVQSAECGGDGVCKADEDCEGWLFDAVGKLGFTRDRRGVHDLAARAKRDKVADASYVLAITRYRVCSFSYTNEVGGFMCVIGYTTAPMNIGRIHNFVAHETCHVFEASDEYIEGHKEDTPTPECEDLFGNPGQKVPNHNSDKCGWDPVTCLMRLNAPVDMCEFTGWQIGWNNREMTRQIIGPSGGPGGNIFYFPFGPGARIAEVQLFSGEYIDSLHVTAEVPLVGRVSLQTFGPGGAPSPVLTLDPDERIVALSGRCGLYIDSLTIHTDKRGAVLSAGGAGGTNEFRYDIPADRDVSGFVGRSGLYLDALGVILDPRASSPAAGTVRYSGPSGGWQGEQFDNPPPAGALRVTKIRVRHATVVDAVGLSYDVGGTPVDGPMAGGSSGRLEEITLDSDEFIVGIAGRYHDVVDSLIIQTNKRFTKRFGGTGGDARFDHIYFGNEEVMGFFGKAKDKVDAIGCIFRRRS
ncbi:MAG TPA: jacalin-like lectin [Pyrinomonadaceae bacterium]|jgi:hypothetical protein|nr:jacalin-like lectin [Pyrinomonadaceae bacterium]